MSSVITFNSVNDACEKFLLIADLLSHQTVTIVGKFDELYSILNNIVKHSDYELYDIDFRDTCIDGYDGEFCLTLDDENHIWVEKCLRFDGDGNKKALLLDGVIFGYKDIDDSILDQNTDVVLFDINDEEQKKKTDKRNKQKEELEKIFDKYFTFLFLDN